MIESLASVLIVERLEPDGISLMVIAPELVKVPKSPEVAVLAIFAC